MNLSFDFGPADEPQPHSPRTAAQRQLEYERRVMIELYRDYDHIVRQHRLKIKPAVIQLFDSETNWGRWHGLQRTISISRRLIKEHPWHVVLAILKHEMAHQVVEEVLAKEKSRDVRKPHGETFARACKMVGVPEQFSKATCDLRTQTLDWREQKRDEVTERLLERVQKLLALAASTDEHEAVLAMERVRQLYAKYNLSEAASSAPSFAHAYICHKKKRIEGYQDRTIGILVEHFFVRAIHTSLFDAETGETHKAVELIGTRENVLMAEYVYHFLVNQSQILTQQAFQTPQTRRSTRLDRNSYRLGILAGFSQKLSAMEKAAPTSTSKAQTPSNPTDGSASKGLSLTGEALEKFHNDPAFKAYVSEIYPQLGKRSTQQSISPDAFSAGVSVGKTVTLSKAVTTSMGNLGRFLEGK